MLNRSVTRRCFLVSLVVAGLIGWTSPFARADVVVIPAFRAASEGDTREGGADLTTGGIIDRDSTIQFIYDTSLLTGITAGSPITGIQFRREGGFGTIPLSNISYTSFDVTLSSSNSQQGSLSTTFNNNIGGDSVLVRSGSLTFPANSFPGGAGPNPFGPLINFTTPYTYTGSDLLVTIRHTGTTEGRFLDAEDDAATMQYLRAAGFAAATAAVNQSRAPVVQLTFTPTVIPEPSSAILLLFGLGLGGLLVLSRRRRLMGNRGTH